RIGNGTLLILVMARDGMIMLVYLAATLYASPSVAALVIAAGLVLLLLPGRDARAASRFGEKMARVGGEAYRAAMERLGGIKMAKSYGAETRSIRLFGDVADTIVTTNLRAAIAQANARRRFNIGAAFVLGIVLYTAIAVVHTPAAVLLILIFAFARVMPLLAGL